MTYGRFIQNGGSLTDFSAFNCSANMVVDFNGKGVKPKPKIRKAEEDYHGLRFSTISFYSDFNVISVRFNRCITPL